MFHWFGDLIGSAIGLFPHAMQGWIWGGILVGIPLFLAWTLVNPDND